MKKVLDILLEDKDFRRMYLYAKEVGDKEMLDKIYASAKRMADNISAQKIRAYSKYSFRLYNYSIAKNVNIYKFNTIVLSLSYLERKINYVQNL